MKKFIAVAFNLPVDKVFWYQCPPSVENKINIGQRVVVPFRKKQMVGFAVKKSSQKPAERLKQVKGVFDKACPLPDWLFKLAKWVGDYYNCSLGQALHTVSPFSYPYQDSEFTGKNSDISSRCSAQRLSSEGREEKSGKKISVLHSAGKTYEFVLSQINRMQKMGKGTLILVPEINSIPGFQKKMRDWKINSITFHSRLSEKERYRRWLAIKRGEADVVLGTRSAVFCPLPGVGSIILNEEQSADYKQKETPKYHGREVAIKRSQLEGSQVFLVSSSPSVESWYRATEGMYELVDLCTEGEKTSPSEESAPSSYHIVDVKKEKTKNRVFSSLLQRKIEQAIGRKGAGILFVPRRGYASFLLCGDCGQVIRCPNCNVGLNFHLRKYIICHLCGFKRQAPGVCPVCEGRNLRRVGWGTQRVELAAKKLFPQATVERFDLDVKDFSPSVVSRRIKEGKVDLLVGTQILMKEEILSLVEVAGIVLVDLLFSLPDFRATEYTFHFLNKIRQNLKKGGSLVVQTYNPDYYALNENRDQFYCEELNLRKALGYPPFRNWTRIVLEGRTKGKVKHKSEDIADRLKKEDFDLLGPSPCPFSKIRGKYRYHIILRTEAGLLPKRNIKKIIPQVMEDSVKMSIDVDPVDMM